jgi:hypothetical protein
LRHRIRVSGAASFGVMQGSLAAVSPPIADAISEVRGLLYLPDQEPRHQCMKGSWRNIKDISGRYRHARQERRHVFASFKRRINSGRLYVRISPEE